MIKRILVTVGRDDYSNAAMQMSIQIAKTHKAELTGIVCLDSESIKKTVGSIPAGVIKFAKKMEESRIQETKDYMNQLLKDFSTKCIEAGVSFRESHFQGFSGKMIFGHSKFYDLVISGLKNDFSIFPHNDTMAKHSLLDILDQTSSPILGIPNTTKLQLTESKHLKILLCVDNSVHAARAMQRFIPLVKPAKCEVTILTSSKKKEKADYLLENTERYLRAHQFNNTNPIWTKQSLVTALKEEYLEWAELVVLGHQSTNTFGFHTGSTIKYLIKEDKKALFIGP